MLTSPKAHIKQGRGCWSGSSNHRQRQRKDNSSPTGAQLTRSTSSFTNGCRQNYPREREAWGLPRLQNDSCRPRSAALPSYCRNYLPGLSGPIKERVRVELPAASIMGALGETLRCLADEGGGSSCAKRDRHLSRACPGSTRGEGRRGRDAPAPHRGSRAESSMVTKEAGNSGQHCDIHQFPWRACRPAREW